VAISEAFAGTEAITTTQWSIPRDASFDVAQPQTDDGIFQLWLDVSDMVTGDELRIRGYEKVQATDTQRLFLQATLTGPQSAQFVTASFMLLHGWDWTLDAPSGTITVTWSLRKAA